MDSFPTVQLFCFPYAGASASVYLRWKRHLPPFIHVIPVELPGHGRLSAQPLLHSMDALVTTLLASLPLPPQQPFAFFGHSLGALVAFECAYRLERTGRTGPRLLFATGAQPPSLERQSSRHTLSDAELRSELSTLAGTPELALKSPELMELVLPVLRADFEIAETYLSPTTRALSCAIHAIGGNDDRIDSQALSAWREHTLSDFTMSVLAGGHFFIHQSEPELLNLISRRLTTERSRAGASTSHATRREGHDEVQLHDRA